MRPMSRSRRGRTGLLLIPSLVLMAAIAVPPVLAGEPSPKFFAATVSPDTVTAGASTPFSVTVTNENSVKGGEQLGSFNLRAPDGFSITAVSPPMPSGTASLGNNVIKARDLSVPPGGSASVDFQATAACSSGIYFWSIRAKSTDDYSGSPGSNFTLDEKSSDLSTAVEGDCSLAFASQPADAEVGDVISADTFNPGGDPITVQVRDGSGEPASTSTALIALSIRDNPGGGTLSGDRRVNADDGVATFDDLSIDAVGLGYTLRARSQGIVRDVSEPFDIVDAGVNCHAKQQCAATIANENTRTRIIAPSEEGESLSLSFLGSLDCPDYSEPVDDVVTWEFTGEGIVRVVVTYFPPIGTAGVEPNGAPVTQICLASEKPFIQQNGEPAPLGKDGFYTGLPADCGVPPCVSRRGEDYAGNPFIEYLAHPGDPKHR
jgi:hypothetical protein